MLGLDLLRLDKETGPGQVGQRLSSLTGAMVRKGFISWNDHGINGKG